MALPFPRLTPPKFASPAKPFGFAYSGCQTFVYNQTLSEMA